jgi:hypothetical protein
VPPQSPNVFVDAPPDLQPYIEYVTFSLDTSGAAGASMRLTDAGVKYARGEGARRLAAWLVLQPQWQGKRTLANVAAEISQHARFAYWPLISNRANPVDLEYFQPWPLRLLLTVPNRIRAMLGK